MKRRSPPGKANADKDDRHHASPLGLGAVPEIDNTIVSYFASPVTRTDRQVLSLAELAEDHNCMGPVDEADGAAPIDVHRLAEIWNVPEEGYWLVDGHLAHLLEVDGIVLLRCDPTALNERLTARGYGARKVKANVEWEMTAGHWAELMEFEIDLPLLELDSTDDGAETAASVQAWVNEGLPSLPLTEQAVDAIDWLGE